MMELTKDRERLFKVLNIYDELMGLFNSDEVLEKINAFKQSIVTSIEKSGYTVDENLLELIKEHG